MTANMTSLTKLDKPKVKRAIDELRQEGRLDEHSLVALYLTASGEKNGSIRQLLKLGCGQSVRCRVEFCQRRIHERAFRFAMQEHYAKRASAGVAEEAG